MECILLSIFGRFHWIFGTVLGVETQRQNTPKRFRKKTRKKKASWKRLDHETDRRALSQCGYQHDACTTESPADLTHQKDPQPQPQKRGRRLIARVRDLSGASRTTSQRRPATRVAAMGRDHFGRAMTRVGAVAQKVLGAIAGTRLLHDGYEIYHCK